MKLFQFNTFLKFYVLLFGTLTLFSLALSICDLYVNFNLISLKNSIRSCVIFFLFFMLGIHYHKIQAYF